MNCATCGARMVPMILSSFCPNDCDRNNTELVDGPNDMRWRMIRLPRGGTPPAGWLYAGWINDSTNKPNTHPATWLSKQLLEERYSNQPPHSGGRQLLEGRRGGGGDGPYHPAYLVPV